MASEIIRRTTEIPFVGREEFLNNLDAHWENTRIIGIHGLRSVGKTRTLFQFLKRKRERSRTDNVSGDRPGPSDDRLQIVYVDLRTLNTCDAFCSHVCAQLEIELKQPHRNIAHVVAQISRVVHKTLNCSTVFIFDNAEDAIEEKEGQFLLSFCSAIIVKCKNVKIILTSTTKASFAGVGKVHASLELLPFTFKESSDFLKQLTRSLDYGEHFDSIATLCEGQPLVILMVASELLRGTAPGQMVEFLTDCRIEALSKESYPSDDRIGDVYSKFIDRLSLVLKERLAILGYIPGSFNVWEAKEMTGHINETETKMETILPIRSRNLIQNAKTYSFLERRFDIHGVLRDCLRLLVAVQSIPGTSLKYLSAVCDSQLLHKEVRERYCRTFGTVMKRISSQMDTREYSKAVLEFTVEHPNLEKLLKDVFFSTEETYHFYIEIVSSCSALIEKYMSAQGEKFYTACLKLATDNGRPYDMAAVYIALGNMHTNSKGEYSSGGKIFEQALTLLEHGPPTTKLAVVCEQFGYNLYMQGRGQESLRVLSKSLETLRLLGHQNTEEFLATMSFLGVTYTFLGRYEEAEKYLTDTLNRRKDIQGENHPSVGDQLNRLGILYEQMGMMEKARYYFKRGLEKKKQTKAAKISIVYSLSNVGRQYGEIGKFDKAELVLNEAMGILETESIKNIGAVGLIHNSFGKVYLRKKDYKNAVKHMLESVRIKEMIMQSDPGPFFINPLILLAKGYIGCENYGAAISRIHQALALKDHILKKLPQNDLIFQCYEALANIYFALGNDKLESDTKIEMEKELFRLIKVHEEKQNEAKVVEFNKKLQSLWKT